MSRRRAPALKPFSGSAKAPAFPSKILLIGRAFPTRRPQPWTEKFRLPWQVLSSQREALQGPRKSLLPQDTCPSGTMSCCPLRLTAAPSSRRSPRAKGALQELPPNRKPKSQQRLLLTAAPEVGAQPRWPGPDPPLVEAVAFPGGLREGQLRKHVGHVVAVER